MDALFLLWRYKMDVLFLSFFWSFFWWEIKNGCPFSLMDVLFLLFSALFLSFCSSFLSSLRNIFQNVENSVYLFQRMVVDKADA